MSKKNVFCCICGKELTAISENETGYSGEFEQYACPTHSEEEFTAYVNENAEGFDSRTGKKLIK